MYWLVRMREYRGQYLCDLEGYKCPQWYTRKDARRFDSADDARRWVRDTKKNHPGMGPWDAVIVRVVTHQESKELAANMARRAALELAEGMVCVKERPGGWTYSEIQDLKNMIRREIERSA